ncbi:MAG TPA: dTDP-4-dehydrorhamnose 3,5-epimerase family protein, partial [Candidatus Binatia bacterium]|nr:dTDP-4-dehydrorhamnose 3,5-epimerase family protein [Candidatus Binatia bacterium]
GKVEQIEVTPGKAVFIPRGVANSFQTLEPNIYYSYLVNDHWSADQASRYKFVNLADPDLAIQWPIPLAQAIISEKDQNHPFFKDVTPI